MNNVNNDSWIKLPRSFAKWRWYHDSNMVHLYLYLLLNASLVDEEYAQTTIHRGELITSLPQLSFNTGLSVKNIRTCLTKLTKTKEIKCKTSSKWRLIILLDFNRFQPIGVDEFSIDWIKLYRQICSWRWYKKAKILHLFVHFMIQARVVTLDNEVNVFQCLTSLSQINKETGISIRSIRTCISKLQTTGEILYSPKTTNQKSSVTICNYDTYQVTKNAIGSQSAVNRQSIGSQSANDCVDFQKSKKTTNQKSSVTICNYDTYQVTKNAIGSQSAVNRQSIGSQSAVNRQSIGSQSAASKEYKNIRKEEEKNIGFIVDDARAHVRDFVEVSEVSEEEVSKENEQKKVEKESFADKVLGEQVWLQAIQKKFKLPCIDTVKQMLDEFETDLICRGKEEHKDEQDYKSHFCDWLAKSNNARHSGIPAPQGGGYQKERWPGELYVPKSSEGGIYEGKF